MDELRQTSAHPSVIDECNNLIALSKGHAAHETAAFDAIQRDRSKSIDKESPVNRLAIIFHLREYCIMLRRLDGRRGPRADIVEAARNLVDDEPVYQYSMRCKDPQCVAGSMGT